MPDLVPVDVYTDGAVLDTDLYNKGLYYATTPASGRFSVLNGRIDGNNLDAGFVATPRHLQPLQGPRGFNAEGGLTKSYYNDYNTSETSEDLFTVHGITLEFDVPHAYDLCMWQMGFYLSHWRVFLKGEQEATLFGSLQDMRYRLSLDGSALSWTTRGLGCTARVDGTATANDLTILEKTHQRYAHISHMQQPLNAGRHYLELRVYMKQETVPDTTELKIADNEYDVDVTYYSRMTFGLFNVCAITM